MAHIDDVTRRCLLPVHLVAAIAVTASCSSESAATWPGTFYQPYGEITVLDRSYQVDEVEILCSESDDGLQIVLTTPDGTTISSTRPGNGTPSADIDVFTGIHGSEIIPGGAVWSYVNGNWGFEQDHYDGEHDLLNFHAPNAAICPSNH